jgi:hypothetical protein
VTGPKDPGEQWGFPEVDPAGPTSVELPAPPPEPVYDTGSDAWWRAQAKAQRAAAESDPVPQPPPAPEPEPVALPAPPELVEPQVLLPPNPLDVEWLPPSAPEPTARPIEPLPVAQVAPVEPLPVAQGPEAPTEEPPVTSYDAEPRLPAPHEGESVGPARAVAGAVIAVAGVALAIGALLFVGKDEPKGTPTAALPTAAPTHAPTKAPTPTPTPTPVATAPPVMTPPTTAQARVIPVAVLNNSRVSRLAHRAAVRFRAGGWPVPTEGNYRGLVSRTTIYYAAGQQASAERFAAQFGIPRVLPRSALPGLPTSGTTVVITRDYRA